MSDQGRAKRILVNFKQAQDPSAEQVALVREAIAASGGARVLDEFPGTIQLEVAEDDAPALSERVAKLEHWDLVDEGLVEMPHFAGRQRPQKRRR